MTSFRTSHLVRLATVLVAMIGWFALSNRCALAQLAQSAMVEHAHPATTVHDCCAPSGEQPCHPASDTQAFNECCQKPQLVMPAEAKVPAATETWMPLDLWTAWCVVVAIPLEPTDPVTAFGPPPEAPTFVQLVLHRSLHSHAPPRLS